MFGLQANNHAMEMEKIQRRCHASGAPDFMWDFLKLLSVKTAFNIRVGTQAMIQPFISGSVSREDAINISEVTGFVLNMEGVFTIEQYKHAINRLYDKLK